MRILVTAGPTREHWDRVRFLSSAATGRMGIEVALAAARSGHEAVLVIGPTHLDAPEDPSIEVRPVVSARDMLAACEAVWPECDALVATAAVADYRPAQAFEGKLAKGAGPQALELARNPDVLATLAATKGRRPVVGFALQVEDAELRAREKLRDKNLDAIVLDGPEAMGVAVSDFVLIEAGGTVSEHLGATKTAIATRIVQFVERLAG